MTKGGRAFRAKVLDLRHPFFDPLWRKLVLVAVLAVWTIFEFAAGNPFWAFLVGGIGVYAVCIFFFAAPLPDKDQRDPKV